MKGMAHVIKPRSGLPSGKSGKVKVTANRLSGEKEDVTTRRTTVTKVPMNGVRQGIGITTMPKK